MHLIQWKARRAGGRITINGLDKQTGQPTKIVGVDVIEPGRAGDDGFCIAVDKSSAAHRLYL